MGLLHMRILYYTVQHVHTLWVCLIRYPVCGKSAKVFFVKSHISSIHESFFPRKVPAIRYNTAELSESACARAHPGTSCDS